MIGILPIAYVGGYMDNRNVKIIDEHGIDRNGNVICTLGVDGKEYVLYSIERDTDNDNLFVSLLTKNNDGTANMVNIEDNMEKNAVSDIAKQVVTFSVNNEAEKTNGNVKLPNGKEVTIGTALFNKEQNINVSKTYITTVKKSVTKVSGDFYKVENKQSVPQMDVFEPVVNNQPSVEMPAVAPVPEPVVEPVLPEVTPEVVNTEVPATPAVEPILPVTPEPVSTPEVSAVEPVLPPVMPEPVVAPAPAAPVVPEPILPPAEPAPVVAPVVESTPAVPASDNNGLVFDASKETNLNAALGEVTSDAALPVQDVSPIREFGQDQATPEMSISNVPPTVTPEAAVVPPASTGGFASNKFFTVIAIILFVGACVFLGYEAFRYFNLVK